MSEPAEALAATTDQLVVERSGPVLRLMLNRPDAANSLSVELADGIVAALEQAAEHRVHVVVISGNGKHFCAGADLRERVSQQQRFTAIRAAIDALDDYPGFVVAAIDGACLGGGLELALACDYRIATERSQFALPEIRFGMLPAAGGPQRASRLVGASFAKWLVASGERIDASTARERGLIEALAPDDGLEDLVEHTIEPIANRARYAVVTATRSIDAGASLGLCEALDHEYEAIDTMATPEERAAEVDRAASGSATYSRLFAGPDSKDH